MALVVDSRASSGANNPTVTIGSSAPKLARAGQVFWQGRDGNIWLRESNGTTTNLGTPQQAKSWDLVLNGAKEIGDPVAPPQEGGGSAQAVPGANGSGSGTTYTDTSAARGATLSSIVSLDSILNNKLAQAQGDYEGIIKSYDEEDALNQGQYDRNVASNEGNRDAQHQAALLAAANGGRGLYSTLASIGALGGTGRLLANRAVSNEANIDIGNADKTFTSNATNLFDTFSKLKQQEEQRRRDAESTLRKTQQQNRYDVTSQRQQLYKDMADLWTKAGNNGEAANSLGRASALNADLVENTRPTVGEYARAPLQFSAPALQSYLAGANDMSVSTSAGAQLPINGAIFTSTKKRDQLT